MIDNQIMAAYTKRVYEYARKFCEKDQHILLLLDEASAHIAQPIRAFAQDNPLLHIMIIPANATSWLQPLDVLGFVILKKTWRSSVGRIYPSRQVMKILWHNDRKKITFLIVWYCPNRMRGHKEDFQHLQHQTVMV